MEIRFFYLTDYYRQSTKGLVPLVGGNIYSILAPFALNNRVEMGCYEKPSRIYFKE